MAEDAVDRQLAAAADRATDALASVLDVEAGLREVLRNAPAPAGPGAADG